MGALSPLWPGTASTVPPPLWPWLLCTQVANLRRFRRRPRGQLWSQTSQCPCSPSLKKKKNPKSFSMGLQRVYTSLPFPHFLKSQKKRWEKRKKCSHKTETPRAPVLVPVAVRAWPPPPSDSGRWRRSGPCLEATPLGNRAEARRHAGG